MIFSWNFCFYRCYYYYYFFSFDLRNCNNKFDKEKVKDRQRLPSFVSAIYRSLKCFARVKFINIPRNWSGN